MTNFFHLSLQVLFADVAEIVPEEYVTKKLTVEMRMITYSGTINGKSRSFHVFCKIEKCMSPRDVTSLKYSLHQFIRRKASLFQEDDHLYQEICAKVFARQVGGKRKKTHCIRMLGHLADIKIDI